MKKLGILSSTFTCLVILLAGSVSFAQDAGQTPAIAHDTVNNRYLMVWSAPEGSGSQIKGKFLNPDGSDLTGDILNLSPDRSTQGCFYGGFDSDNGAISTPSNCPNNLNPTVAYNDGQYLIAWEVHGMASAPSSAPENQFRNIFARIVDANSLDPLSGWEEGILISKVFIAANNADACGNGKFACNDGEIQAWSQSQNPHVAPRLGAGGFIVAWQSNKDFIGCASADRRGGLGVYGRYIDQSFSATSTTNPVMFAIFKDDSTMEENCATLDNVDNASNPRIAFNQATNDFVIVYQIGRANGGRLSIGAKKATLNAANVGQVGGSMMPSLVASVDEVSLQNPEIVSFKNSYVLFTDDGSNIRVKSFGSDGISNSTPMSLNLGGGSQSQARGASNLGAGGQGPTSGSAPERLILTYREGADVFTALLSESLDVLGSGSNQSAGQSVDNQHSESASNGEDFLTVWQGSSSGDKVYVAFTDSASGPMPTPTPMGMPPTAPGLVLPNDGVTFAPTRAYLSWNASTDPDGDDSAITYNIYFGENVLPGTPQETGVTDTEFVIGPETQSVTGITLEANKVYKWKIEAVDEDSNVTSSIERTINTDNSVAAWWRFDEDPAGSVCPGGAAGETVCDFSGNNNHGVPNGPSWIMLGMPDILGGALDFNGTSDFVEVSDSPSLNPQSFSIQARFKVNGPNGGEQEIVDKRVSGYGYDFRIEGGSSPFDLSVFVQDNGALAESEKDIGGITAGVFYTTFATYDHPSKTVSLYKDGVLIGSHIIGGIFERTMPSVGSVHIGDRSFFNPTASWFNGDMDEIILFNKEIGASEVGGNYQAIEAAF